MLALDYGSARTGVAVSDPTGMLARPLTVVERAASEAGLARLARIDRVRAACDSAWSLARTERDTAAVDRLALPDTIDKGSSAELARCGNLRPAGLPSRLPNQRELTGERMPGGLR